MRVSDKAVILRSVSHGDSKKILKLYTQTHGTLSAVARVGRSNTSQVRSSTIMPLHFIEGIFSMKQNRELHQLTEASCYLSFPAIHVSPAKLSLAQFMNEVLLKTLQDHPANPELFSFVEATLRSLNDSESGYLQSHLFFMRELCSYAGFEPQNNRDRDNIYFDCREGRFGMIDIPFPMGLNENESKLFSEFLKAGPDQVYSLSERRQLLDILMAYYAMHLPGFSGLRSLDVLRELIA
jgi:DNA repair protein RecO (recombination protein O)